jgi:hypothetical protein
VLATRSRDNYVEETVCLGVHGIAAVNIFDHVEMSGQPRPLEKLGRRMAAKVEAWAAA